MPTQALHLPDELWLQILTYIPPGTIWRSVRKVNRQLQACSEDFTRNQILPHFTIALIYSLGSGTTHRWYEVRATVALAFASLSDHNPQYAKFTLSSVHPDRTAERAREKWKRMCADGLGPEVEWRVRFAMGERERGTARGAQTWRVMFGIDEPADFGYIVKLRRLVVGDDDIVWVDWREMLAGYFRRERTPTQAGDILKA